MTQEFLGIDIGSTSLKMVNIKTGNKIKVGTITHEGNIFAALETLIKKLGIITSGEKAPLCLVTGNEGRKRIPAKEIIAPMAIEKALKKQGLSPKAVVCMGGEDLVVYPINEKGLIISACAGNKCACGTGEFFRQQLGRMNLTLDDICAAAKGASIQKISSRCSVFMKSDCTHKLNKGEATPGDIALSLSKVMADKVSEFLTKARIQEGSIVLTGGVTQNPFIVEFIKKAWPGLEVIVPQYAECYEAYGAALCAQEKGSKLEIDLSKIHNQEVFTRERYKSLQIQSQKVHYVPSLRGSYDPNAEYILGIDGGSTTTKAALINAQTLKIVAAHYGRTHGDPVQALKICINEIKKQIGPDANPKITLAATTGSSRELLGVFAKTKAVFNEIIAHCSGTTFFNKEVDTIFEIGGQDAKYVSVNNGVPIDYAMNEACSAGTGSFLEESCKGDLNIDDPSLIGEIAIKAPSPIKFGEHCSAFINSDIRKAISQGADPKNIVAGLIFSIVSNYLNRVVGNRRIGNHIVLQGGVAKNQAIPLAFAVLTQKDITVPPEPELMGCFGVALVAKQKADENILEPGSFDLNSMLTREIKNTGSFTCKACDNYCSIRRLEIDDQKYPFGGRCSKFSNSLKTQKNKEAIDYVAIRSKMLFEDFAAPQVDQTNSKIKVGVPMAFSVHSLWPLYSNFFHSLGVCLVPSEKILPEGISKIESNYCFPSEIAHGALADTLNNKPDFVFLPFLKKMPSHEKPPVHATLCPLTQGMPFFLKQAFNLDEKTILQPVVNMKKTLNDSQDEFEKIAQQMGFSKEAGATAYQKGVAKQEEFLKAYGALGQDVLKQIKEDPDSKYICLVGRPYNAFTKDANMGIPRKLLSNGVSVVPFDMIYDPTEEIFPNMYWYYGQQDMKAVRLCAKIPNLYPIWISNFSCAPDSFMLHYLRWMMGQKPYLVLEIDSHSADAGIDTRIEAFLDIVDSFTRAGFTANIKPFLPRYKVEQKKEYADIVDTVTGKKIDMRDPKVKFIWSSMGEYSSAFIAAASRRSGINSFHLPIPTWDTVQLARNVASGKECIPSLIVLGGILQYLQNNKPQSDDEILLFYMPSTLGPCRTGQYYVFYERLFEELGFQNALIMVCESSNSYRELGSSFTKDAWWGVLLGDFFTDIRYGIKLLAKDQKQALDIFNQTYTDVIDTFSNKGNVENALERAAHALCSIEKKQTLEDIKKVLIVGEIYVRRDDFSVGEIADFLVEKNIFPKIAGISEWLDYTDHCRWRSLQKQKKRESLLRIVTSGAWKNHVMYMVEDFYKHMVQDKISRHLKPTGFVPDVPTDMHEIIGNTEKYFLDARLESEATCSSGAAATGMIHGYNGAVIIAPFSCLPGRLVEGVYGPWARQKGYPYICLENDGLPYPPGVRARMEIFAYNVTNYSPMSTPEK